MDIKVTITATITVPDGSELEEELGRQITLPDGDWIKPFIVLELNDTHDLPWMDANARGCDVVEARCEYEVQD
jgi:hypothetical protein